MLEANLPISEVHGKIPSLQETLYSSGSVMPENCFTVIIFLSRAFNLEHMLEAERENMSGHHYIHNPWSQYCCGCLEWLSTVLSNICGQQKWN